MTNYPSEKNIENLKNLLPLLKKEENKLIEKTQKKIDDFLRLYPHFHDDYNKIKTTEMCDIYQKIIVYFITLVMIRNMKNNTKEIEIL